MKNQEINNLINQYFKGQLAPEDYGRLSELLKDKHNLRLFDQAKIKWDQAPEETPSAKKNWIKVQAGIHKPGKVLKPPLVTRKLFTRVGSVAAIIVFVFLVGALAGRYFTNQNPFNQSLVFETPRGEKSMVTLPDGSQVWLNASSKLVCHAFNNHSRNVELTGEAFFKVAHNEHAPFHVKTDECVVEVLGTEFNVMAYNNFGRKEIALLKGKVNVKFQNSSTVLAPGEALIVKNHKAWVTKMDAVHAMSWVDNKFDFQNISLTELVKRLENWYDIDIELENAGNKEVNFTGTFKNEETILEVLDAIKVYMPIQYEKTDTRKIKMMVK